MVGERDAGLILVVEDDYDLCDLVTAVLELYLDVRTARVDDGERAMELVQALEPDLVIVDIRSPGFDGLEVLRRLKADPTTRAVPLVAMASEPAPSTAGCDYHFTKPSDLVSLVGILRKDLDARLQSGAAA